MASASPDQVSPPTSLVHPPRRPPAVPPSRPTAVPPSRPEEHLQPPSPTAVESNSQAASHPSSAAVEDNDGVATSRTHTRLSIDDFSEKFVTDRIKDIIQGHFDGAWISYLKIPVDYRDRYFQLFQTTFYWDKSQDKIMRTTFHTRAGIWLKGALATVRREKECPNWIKKEMYPKMVEVWDGDRFKRTSEANKKNREAGPSTVYRGGSAPMGRYKKKLSKEGKSTTILDVFKVCFRKSNGTLDNSRALQAVTNYARLRDEALKKDPNAPINEAKLWAEAVGGVKKCRLYGTGSLGRQLVEQALMPTDQNLRDEYNLLQKELQNLRDAIMEYGISIPRRDQPTSTQGSQNMENVQHPEVVIEHVDEHAGQPNTMQNLDSPASQYDPVDGTANDLTT
ncbi:Transposase, Ptta/En/Spm, plant [Corchorus capsularis]|uniref:Transposase, Ptta/En/Spm, plant n=1 Tax=Corchorus capsularis TaxID=210143 RepID=A0A1R3GNL2_COCAP|nr:Transposase, Ptta/En/Spm, plant [Corchorus capsularis]